MTDLGDAIEGMPLPPASAMRGTPGHDQALDSARIIRMVRAKVAGATYEQIGEREQYADRSGARNVIIRALRAEQTEAVGELRSLENMRLDTAQAAIWPYIIGAYDPEQPGYVEPAVRMQAVTTFARLSKRRADMNGLDAPKQVQVSAGVAAQLDEAFAGLRLVVQGSVVPEPEPDTPEALEA